MSEAIKKQLKAAVFAVLGVGLSALFSILFTDTSSQWYTALHKPVFLPPQKVFMVAWIILYLMLAIALQRQLYRGDRQAVYGFIAILTLTALWNYAFFTLQNSMAGLLLLLLCVLATLYTIRQIGKEDVLSTVLLFAFLAWIVFATVLQYYIYMMN